MANSNKQIEQLHKSIINKILAKDKCFRFRRDQKADVTFSPVKTPEHRYPCMLTSRQIVYTSRALNPHKQLKVAFNLSTKQSLARDVTDHDIPITNYSIGPGMVWYAVQDVTQARKFKSYMESRLIRYFMETYETETGAREALLQNKIPRVKLTRKWNNHDVYRLFDITDQERKLIESVIK